MGQDWGGLIGLRLAAEQEGRFARIVAANTFLPTGDIPPKEGFWNWRRFAQETPVFRVGEIVQRLTASDVPPEVSAAYDTPFPDECYQAGARQFPMLVPISSGTFFMEERYKVALEATLYLSFFDYAV